jgi:integrase
MWQEEFIASAGRRGCKDSTIRFYSDLMRYVSQGGVDLATVSEQDLLAFLDRFRSTHSIYYYGELLVVVKMVLRFLKRGELADGIPNPRRPDRAEQVKKKVLSGEDRRKLVEKAPTLQDRVVIELLDETGARRAEIHNLRIKDVGFDQYGGILWLTGKTGTRRRRVYTSVPDLRELINQHPQHQNPEARLWLTGHGTPISYRQFYIRVRNLGERILGRPIHPHMFRHTRATEDSRNFTDREMMLLFGWKRPDVVGVYSHLSMRDVEDKDLVLHGLKTREEILKPIMQVQICGKCKQQNAPVAVFCNNCGAVLAAGPTSERIEALEEMLASVKHQMAGLEKAEEARKKIDAALIEADKKLPAPPKTRRIPPIVPRRRT